jgi:ATP-dependent DNA helicase PIF1
MQRYKASGAGVPKKYNRCRNHGGAACWEAGFLPRIPLCPPDDEMFPFFFKRKQFPIRLSFVMTVNKSHGQTIPNVGVYLPAPVFSHGQLYVAISRATSRTNIKSLALPPNADAREETKKMEKKNAKMNVKGKNKNVSNKKDKIRRPPLWMELPRKILYLRRF